MKTGRPTEQATILVCQCKGTSFQTKQRTKRSVALTCARCGLRTSVHGSIATARVPQQEVVYAVAETVTAPDPTYGRGGAIPADPDAPDRKPTLKERGIETLRFGLLVEAKRVVQRALEIGRVENHQEIEGDGRSWQGRILELICANYIAGADLRAIAIVDEKDRAEAELVARAEAEGRTAPARERWMARRKVEDRMRAERYQPAPDPVVVAAQEHEAQRAAERADDAADDRIVDEVSLLLALERARDEHQQIRGEMGRSPTRILIGAADDLPHLRRAADEDGGYLLRVRGDARTRTRAGTRPEMFIWMEFEDADNPLDLDVEYEVPGLEDAELEVVELVPADGEVTWPPPTIAHGRAVDR